MTECVSLASVDRTNALFVDCAPIDGLRARCPPTPAPVGTNDEPCRGEGEVTLAGLLEPRPKENAFLSLAEKDFLDELDSSVSSDVLLLLVTNDGLDDESGDCAGRLTLENAAGDDAVDVLDILRSFNAGAAGGGTTGGAMCAGGGGGGGMKLDAVFGDDDEELFSFILRQEFSDVDEYDANECLLTSDGNTNGGGVAFVALPLPPPDEEIDVFVADLDRTLLY
ncbi:hypothetical protein TRICI_004919 [Trichomonascus ciferrii]|uniref:Uncharacterized protein n=1 Tax=Trichomonascus ciferrii TaxID=44093 RepID=A0A642UY39_9ASCO|nr:hypothetical protein TRICI_004919 [Trichomonascus ciferrii]